MKARYFRYQYENTQDGILQSGCIWDRRVDKKTTYLYAAGEYAGIPRIARDQEKKWGRKEPETILDIFVLGAYTVPYICRLLEILQEQGVRTVVLPYIPPMIRLSMMTYIEKNGKTDRELQRFLGAPYSYLKEQGVENIYLLYGNGQMLPREQDNLLEGHYFERVDRRIQEMVTEMEGVFIPVYYAGYIVENQWLYYFGTYGVEMQMNTGVKLELDTITMFTGPLYARNREMECMLTTKVFTREQHCNIQIKEEYETCALKCLYRNDYDRNDYDMLKKHMDSKHEMLRVGLLNLGNVNLNTSLKNVIARYGSVVEQVRGISVPNSGKEAFWNEKLLSVFTGTDLEYYICACDKNTGDKVIRDIALSSAYNRFINVNEEFAYCFSGYLVEK